MKKSNKVYIFHQTFKWKLWNLRYLRWKHWWSAVEEKHSLSALNDKKLMYYFIEDYDEMQVWKLGLWYMDITKYGNII